MNTLQRIQILTVFFFITVSFQTTLCESPKYAVGLTGGYFNAYNDVHYKYSCGGCGNLLDDFAKSSYFFGIAFENSLGLGLESSIIWKLYYNSFSFFYSKKGSELKYWEYDSVLQHDVIKSLKLRWDWEGKYSLLSLDILPKIKIPYFGLGVFAGISFSYLLESNYNEVYRMLESGNVRFIGPVNEGYRMSENKKEIFMREGEIPDKNDLRFGIKAGLTYDFEIWGFLISPFLAFDYPLNSVVNRIKLDCPPDDCSYTADAHWRIIYYQAGIDLKYIF
jgi:hypothetical protein